MKANVIILTVLAGLTVVLSCSKDDVIVDEATDKKEIRFSTGGVNIEVKSFSEVTFIPLVGFSATAIVEDDNTVWHQGPARYDRISSYRFSPPCYFPDKSKVSFYGVYPPQSVSLTDEGVFLEYRQDSDIDLIAAKAEGISKQSDVVEMNFNHLLSLVKVNARGAEPEVDYILRQLTISCAEGGTYSFADEEWTPTPTKMLHNLGGMMGIDTRDNTPVGEMMSCLPGEVELRIRWSCHPKGGLTVLCEKDVAVTVSLTQGKRTTINLTLPYEAPDVTFDVDINEWTSSTNGVSLYTPPTVPGTFTVSDSGKKVKFAKGNLFWDGCMFQCEANQFDFPYEWDRNHVGHFYWSRTASAAYAENFLYDGAQTGDTFFAADGGAIEGFTTLSKNEWQYLIDHSLADIGGYTDIAGVYCMILRPDGFTGTVAHEYNADEWAAAEASGLVALPLAGDRDGDYLFLSACEYGCYWTSTTSSDDERSAWCAYHHFGDTYTDKFSCDYGFPVRLVQVQ